MNEIKMKLPGRWAVQLEQLFSPANCVFNLAHSPRQLAPLVQQKVAPQLLDLLEVDFLQQFLELAFQFRHPNQLEFVFQKVLEVSPECL